MGRGLILIVEDDPDVSEAVETVLTDEGYSTRTAKNGEEALAILRGGFIPGLILLDVMMPVMDAFGFRAEQLKDPTLAAIPTVIMSAAHKLGDMARELGVRAYLAKPVALEALLDVVDRVLKQPASSPTPT
ncbi:MAG: response regulator [Polyangiaceae bacterium]|nr:response regulator [Polyangiaceae bacterium]